MPDPASTPRKPRRVLYLLPQPFLIPRGSSFRALATVKAMAELGIEVDLLTYPYGKDVQIPGVRLIRWCCIPCFNSLKIGPSIKKIIMDIPFALKALQLAATSKYDLIHGPEEAGIMAAVYGKILKTPYIYDMHSWMSQQLEESGFIKARWLIKLFKGIEHWCMRQALAIITVGPAMTEILKTLAPGIPAFTLKDCSLDIPQEINQKLLHELSTRHQLDNKIVYLYTGNFEIYQGIDLLLNAFSLLVKRTPEPKRSSLLLMLVGGGAGQEPNIAKYKNMVQELELEKHVVFAGEWPVEEMPTFMHLAQVLVSPRTQGNNVPLKVYTYMGADRISVVSDIDSHTQVLNNDNSIVASTSPAAFADGLELAISENPEVQQNLQKRVAAAKAATVNSADKIEFKEVVKACYSLLK